MTEQLQLLIQIQAIDRKRIEQNEEGKRLPEKLKAAEEALLGIKGELEQLRAQKIKLEKTKKEKDLDLKVQEENIIKLREKLTKLKTNDEYKAHLKEIESAKAKKKAQEDLLLTLMEEEETIKTQMTSKEAAVVAAEAQFDIDRREIEAAMTTLTESSRSMEAQAAIIAEKVEKDILEQYQRLLIQCRGLAVVSLNGQTCNGCHFSLPRQMVADVRIGEKLLTCTYCHRILYIAPQPT